MLPNVSDTFNLRPGYLAGLAYQADPLAPRLRYEAEWTAEYLRNPLVRNVLPACARLPLEVRADPATTHGFVTNGARLAKPEPPTEVSLGSCSAQGPAVPGTFQSLPIRKSRLPYLEIRVAEELGGKDLSLGLVNLATGRRIPVKPAGALQNKWLNCHVKAPPGEFKIVARDASKTAWFAFKAPRELDRLSFWTIQELSSGSISCLRGWAYSCLILGCSWRASLAQTSSLPYRRFAISEAGGAVTAPAGHNRGISG